jgi:thiol-disulfide isomerase/thioredoxin
MRTVKVLGWLLLGVALGAIAGVAFWRSAESAAPATRPVTPDIPPLTAAPAPVVDSPAPDFSLSGPDGAVAGLSEFRGKIVILNFWATWCEPCRDELPLLDRVAREDRDFTAVIAVESGEPETEVRLFLDPLNLMDVRILFDPSGRVRDDYLVRGLPTTFFLDAEGIIRRIKIGTLESSEIETILNQMGAMP